MMSSHAESLHEAYIDHSKRLIEEHFAGRLGSRDIVGVFSLRRHICKPLDGYETNVTSNSKSVRVFASRKDIVNVNRRMRQTFDWIENCG